MGRCLGCKKQTQNFCYVDQEFVCPSCLITTNVHGRCVVGSYRGWVQDSAYKWPPSCVICSEDILTDQGIQRLPCFAIVHVSCLTEKTPVDKNCPHCETSLVPELGDTSPIAESMREVLKDVAWAEEELAGKSKVVQVKPEPHSHSTGGDTSVLQVDVAPEKQNGSGGVKQEVRGGGVGGGVGMDIESGVVDGTPVGDGTAMMSEHRTYRNDDKALKARKEIFRRRSTALKKFLRLHRRQIFILIGLVLCVAMSAYFVGSLVRTKSLQMGQAEEVMGAADLSKVTENFRKVTMPSIVQEKLRSRYGDRQQPLGREKVDPPA